MEQKRKMLLSTFWAFAVLTCIYADVFSLFFDPAARSATPTMGPAPIVFFAAGVIHTALVGWSLLGQVPQPFSLFFAVIETAWTVFIVVYALTWKREAPAGTAPVARA